MDPQEKALIRLQILSPISLLLALAANLVAALAIRPSLGQINDDYLTILTPRKSLVGAYWLLLYVLQIGYCIILAIARKEQTRATILNAVGLRFVFANLCIAAWTLFWELRIFIVSEVFLLLALLLLISIWGVLLVYPTSSSRPLDTLFIHAPIRMFLVLLLVVQVWQNGLLAFRWYKYVGEQPHSPERPGKWEGEHSKHSWIAFGVVMAVGLVNAFVVFLGRDFVWALSTIFLYIALLLKGPKPAQIFIPLVLLSVLQLVSLIASVLYYRYKAKGAIRLEDDETISGDAEAHHRATTRPNGLAHGQEDSFVISGGASHPGPREIED